MGAKTILDFMNLVPYNISQYLLNMGTKKVTMTFTGVPGPKESWKFAGYSILSLGAFVPASGDALVGFSSLSVGDAIRSGLITDLHYMESPDEFMVIYD